MNLRDEVNGLYETLVRVELLSHDQPADAVLKHLEITAFTQINSKTNPALNWGKNTVYLGAGDQSESIVYWPDLSGDKWKSYSTDSGNLAAGPGGGYGVGEMFPAKAGEEGFVVFRMDAPGDITRVVYGGRFAVQNAASHVECYHSFDEGKTWTKSWSLAEDKHDVVHYQTVDDIPPHTRSVLYKYSALRDGGKDASASIYSVRMEADYAPVAKPLAAPLEVTFAWKERQEDYSLVSRSHSQLVTALPFTYTINVGGADHPVMDSLTVNLAGARAATQPATQPAKAGYSDGKEVQAVKWTPSWVTVGKNLALHKPYTISVPPVPQKDSKLDPEKWLTDGIIGAMAENGDGLGWSWSGNPEIAIDLGEAQSCGAFRAAVSCGWPWWDAVKGEVKETIEVLTSTDGKEYASQGVLRENIRLKDVPANVMLPDSEGESGFIAELVLTKPVSARYVKFKVTSTRSLRLMELQAFDSIKYEPFDMKLAMPK